jgi:hypothetical protein
VGPGEKVVSYSVYLTKVELRGRNHSRRMKRRCNRCMQSRCIRPSKSVDFTISGIGIFGIERSEDYRNDKS